MSESIRSAAPVRMSVTRRSGQAQVGWSPRLSRSETRSTSTCLRWAPSRPRVQLVFGLPPRVLSLAEVDYLAPALRTHYRSSAWQQGSRCDGITSKAGSTTRSSPSGSSSCCRPAAAASCGSRSGSSLGGATSSTLRSARADRLSASPPFGVERPGRHQEQHPAKQPSWTPQHRVPDGVFHRAPGRADRTGDDIGEPV